MLDILVAEIGLQGPGIHGSVGEMIATSMAQHVWMKRKAETGCNTKPTGAELLTSSIVWEGAVDVTADQARAHIELGNLEDACSSIGEAIEVLEMSKERWCEAEVYRMAGEITLMAPEPDTAKAEPYFERALAIARSQQSKSWELRAATSLAQLWRHQSKQDEARDLLTPVYDWFTEGLDTRDLKEAKALLGTLV
jgi:hypothetical protein